MRSLNQEIQFKNRNLFGNRDIVESWIHEVLDNYRNLNIDKSQIIKGIDEFIKIYKIRYSYDYYYTLKDMTLEILEKYRDQLNLARTK
jgi:hypothetical protein